jgi:outer membrane protein TolC
MISEVSWFWGEEHSMKSYQECLVAVVFAASMFMPGPCLHGQQAPSAPAAAPAQNFNMNFGNRRWFPNVWDPYVMPYVPETKMSNSERLHTLLSDGKLRLSLQDVIELTLENNLDIAVARYTIAYSQTDLLRTHGGGAMRGFNGSFQSSALYSGAVGSGVSASTSGVSSGAGAVSGTATATQLGGGTFDPSAFFSLGWNQNTTPLGTTVVTGVPYEYNQGTTYFSGVQQAFQTGTSYMIGIGGERGANNALTDAFNPFVYTYLAAGFTQPLLNGFGRRANALYIRIAKNNMKSADSVFREQVMTTMAQVLNLYWDYLSFRENVRVAEQALAYSQKLLADNKRQVEIGTLAPIEVVRAESEVASDQQKLIVAQTNLQQQGELIKTAVAKKVDGELIGAQIEAMDKLPEPRPDDIPSLDEALRLAFANRPEIEQTELNLRDEDYNIAARRNSLLPSLNIFGTYIATGLSGHQGICPAGESSLATYCESAGAVVPPLGISTDGVSQALTQTIQGRYTNYSLGMSLSIPIRNRTAQADMARALLERRQFETQLQQSKNNIAQQVRNANIGVIQARAQIEAARKATILAQQTLDAEEKKFKLGESTVFLVIQAQRDLATAEGNEVSARSTYAKALTTFQQQTGTILREYNVELSDAVSGHVTRAPNIPGSAEQPIPEKPGGPPQG